MMYFLVALSNVVTAIAVWFYFTTRPLEIVIEDDLKDLGKQLIDAKEKGVDEFTIELINDNCEITFIDDVRSHLESLL
jgi:hypothetical protein